MTSRTRPQRAVIFHGYGATPADHWFGWLADQLQTEGITTTVPVLSHPLQPASEQWEAEVGDALGTPDERSAVIAHSLGCLAVLRYLHSLSQPWCLGTLVLVSGFVDLLPALPELDGFIGHGCDVNGLSQHVGRIVILRSDDDPLVAPELTDRLATQLHVSPRVVPGAGHFLSADGFTSLPDACDAVLS